MKDNRENIFFTPVWGVILNDQKYQARDYLDTILQMEQNTPGVKKSNMGGYQTPDNLHKVPIFRELVSTLELMASQCFSDYTSNQNKMVVTEMWGNVNRELCSNGAHTHGQDLSGVFYLKAPVNSGRLILCNPAVRADGRSFRASNYPITPEALACIFFPSWLEHYVEPNYSKEERISISFNMKIV